jgi:glycosyltransferase involved in cell wall biosynthesis
MFNQIKQAFSKAGKPTKKTPVVSIVVIVYDMPGQAQKTIESLGTSYQQDVQMDDFEVIIVENESPNLMDSKFIASLPTNFHYHKRVETEATPVHAINYGATKAKGEHICLMVDGARMLTPGVLKNILLGHRISDRAIVSIPGYHLGDKVQQENVSSGYGLEAEQELIRSIDWPNDGYRLFDIACLSSSSEPGFFLPNSESNCISLPRDVWHALGGYDVQFNMRGGGLINLDFYKRACEFPGLTHVVIPGEGTFHQFHGGVTTGGEDEKTRAVFIEACEAQYRKLRGGEFTSPVTKPIYLGQLSQYANRFLHHSSNKRIQSMGDKR